MAGATAVGFFRGLTFTGELEVVGGRRMERLVVVLVVLELWKHARR